MGWAGSSRAARLGVSRSSVSRWVALYAGEGSKTDCDLRFVNTDPGMVSYFCCWLRRFFEVDESRLRVALYLHEAWTWPRP